MSECTEIITTPAPAQLAPREIDGGILGRMDAAIDSLSEESDNDTCATAWMLMKAIEERVDAMKARLREVIGERIAAKGSVRFSDTNFLTIKPQKKTKCRNNRECLEALIEQFGPAYVGERFLASGAFRYGAVAKELSPEDFERLFETTMEPEIKEAGRTVREVNTAFLR